MNADPLLAGPPPSGISAGVGRPDGTDGPRLWPVLTVEWADGTVSHISAEPMADEMEAASMAITMLMHTCELFESLGITLKRTPVVGQ